MIWINFENKFAKYKSDHLAIIVSAVINEHELFNSIFSFLNLMSPIANKIPNKIPSIKSKYKNRGINAAKFPYKYRQDQEQCK